MPNVLHSERQGGGTHKYTGNGANETSLHWKLTLSISAQLIYQLRFESLVQGV